MRKGRFELWLGTFCAAAVLLTALLGSFRREIHAGYLFWRFNNGADEAECGQVVRKMLLLGEPAEPRLRRILVADARELQVLKESGPYGSYVTVLNDRSHRVLLRCWSGGNMVIVDPQVWSVANRTLTYTCDETAPSLDWTWNDLACSTAVIVKPGETVHVLIREPTEYYPDLCFQIALAEHP